MAFYALSLSAGSLIGPLIAGYLVLARGWRWFFIVCAILAAVNLLMTIFLLPETTYELEAETEPFDLSAEEKDNGETREYCDIGSSSFRMELFSITRSKAVREKGVLKHWLNVFCLPLSMILNPGVFIASTMYGVALGW